MTTNENPALAPTAAEFIATTRTAVEIEQKITEALASGLTAYDPEVRLLVRAYQAAPSGL